MITFRDADERIAWDRFVAAGISHPDMTFKQVLLAADDCIEERRKREPKGWVMNYAVDETKAGPR